jgi:hypothetical protein
MNTKKQLDLMISETSENPTSEKKTMIDLMSSLEKIVKNFENTDKVKTFMLSEYLVKYPFDLPDDFKDIPLVVNIILNEGKLTKSIGIYLNSDNQLVVCNGYGITIKSSIIESLHVATTSQLKSYGIVTIQGVKFKIPIFHKKIHDVSESFSKIGILDNDELFYQIPLDFNSFDDFMSQSKVISVYPFQLPDKIKFEIVTNYREKFEYYFLVKGNTSKGEINMVIKPDRELLTSYLDDKYNHFTIESKYTESRKKGDNQVDFTLCNYSFS